MEKYHSCLDVVPIFQNMDQSSLIKINEVVQHRTFKKGDFISDAGTEADELIIVEHGQLKVFDINEDGQEKIVSLMQKGDFDGELALFAKQIRSYSTQAITNGEFCSIKKNDFQAILNQSVKLSTALVNDFGEKLVKLQQKSIAEKTQSALERVANYLLEYSAELQKDEFELPIKKVDLAGVLNMTPETLSRKLAQLAHKNLIGLTDNKIKIINEDELSLVD